MERVSNAQNVPSTLTRAVRVSSEMGKHTANKITSGTPPHSPLHIQLLNYFYALSYTVSMLSTLNLPVGIPIPLQPYCPARVSFYCLSRRLTVVNIACVFHLIIIAVDMTIICASLNPHRNTRMRAQVKARTPVTRVVHKCQTRHPTNTQNAT